MNKRKSVFISYSSKDRLFVSKLTQLLEAMYISYWKAPEMIPTGSSYAREIPKAIKECEVFLLVVSANSQESIWVEKEMDCAVYNRKEIIPVMIDEEPLSDTFRFYLNNVQMIPYAEKPQKAIELLKFKLYEIFEDAVDVSEAMSRQIMKPDQKIYKKAPVKEADEKILKAAALSEKKTVAVKKATGKPESMEATQKEDGKGISNEKSDKVSGSKQIYGKNQEMEDYKKVRDFLEKHGACNALTIQKNTGVSRRVIEKLLSENYLEVIDKNHLG